MFQRTGCGIPANATPQVTLREIDEDSVRAICALAVGEDQKKFVAPNADSILVEQVAQDIAEGVVKGRGTILSGKGVHGTALMKRLLPRRTFRKLLISASRKMGYLPRQ